MGFSRYFTETATISMETAHHFLWNCQARPEESRWRCAWRAICWSTRQEVETGLWVLESVLNSKLWNRLISIGHRFRLYNFDFLNTVSWFYHLWTPSLFCSKGSKFSLPDQLNSQVISTVVIGGFWRSLWLQPEALRALQRAAEDGARSLRGSVLED